MEADTRRIVAYIAGRIRLCDSCRGVFDHAEQKEFSYSGIVRPEHISVYDFIRKCHVGGQRSKAPDAPEYFSLYDFGNGHHLTLSFEGQHFSGFDHRANKEFTGTIAGGSITIHDTEAERDFFYSV